MIYIKGTIPEFLRDARALIFGVRDDEFIKQRVLAYNITDEDISSYEAIYAQAEQAESLKSKEVGEQVAAGEISDRQVEEAYVSIRKHIDFLRLALRNDDDKYRQVFLSGPPRSKRLSAYLKYMKEMYDRVLADAEVVAKVGRYAIANTELEEGRNKVILADEAKRKHMDEMSEAQDATQQRDLAFEALKDAVDELKMVCTYALDDRPQMMEKLGVQVLSPGYKRQTSKKEPPENGDTANTTDTTDTTDTTGTGETGA